MTSVMWHDESVQCGGPFQGRPHVHAYREVGEMIIHRPVSSAGRRTPVRRHIRPVGIPGATPGMPVVDNTPTVVIPHVVPGQHRAPVVPVPRRRINWHGVRNWAGVVALTLLCGVFIGLCIMNLADSFS